MVAHATNNNPILLTTLACFKGQRLPSCWLPSGEVQYFQYWYSVSTKEASGFVCTQAATYPGSNKVTRIVEEQRSPGEPLQIWQMTSKKHSIPLFISAPWSPWQSFLWVRCLIWKHNPSPSEGSARLVKRRWSEETKDIKLEKMLKCHPRTVGALSHSCQRSAESILESVLAKHSTQGWREGRC